MVPLCEPAWSKVGQQHPWLALARVDQACEEPVLVL
jgi:hypothetical protein